MARARDTGQPAASGRVTLVQEIDEDEQAGFLIYVPVYEGGVTPDTIEARRDALIGFVYSPFRMDDLLDGVLGTTHPRLAVDIYDSVLDPGSLMHRSTASSGRSRFHHVEPLEVVGRDWIVAFRSGPSLDVGSRVGLVPWVFGSGVFFSLVLAGLAEMRSRQHQALSLQAWVVESMGEGVTVADESGTILYTNPAEDRMFGYEPGELVGKHVTVQNTYPPPENARIVAGIIEQLRRNGILTGEFSNVRKDGTPSTTLARITALSLAGKRYLVAVQEDVTHGKCVEEERRELLGRERVARAEARPAVPRTSFSPCWDTSCATRRPPS